MADVALDRSRTAKRPSSGEAAQPSLLKSEAFWISLAISWLLAWLPLQTTLALVTFQYGGWGPEFARASLLVKDVAVIGLIGILLFRHRRHLELRWFDYVALAYLGVVLLYSLVPRALGSEIPLMAVAASARILILPVELYALGRLAFLSGANVQLIVRVFLGVAAVAAALSVLAHLALPSAFWATNLDLPRFVREVQGYPGATDLSQISVVVSYGLSGAEYSRATWPFTHPVGTGHYFVLPLVLSIAGGFNALSHKASIRRLAPWGGLVLLFIAAVLVPVSRGAWVAAGVAAILCGAAFGRRAFIAAVAGVGVVLALALTVPPFSLSIFSAVGASDPSVTGHSAAVEDAAHIIVEHPLGLGVGNGDHPGTAFGAGEAIGLGENMYFSVLIALGPLGILTLTVWIIAVGVTLWRGYRARQDWMAMAMLACLVGFAVSSVTASPLMRFTTAASFWLLVGLLVALGPPIPPPHRGLFTLGVFADAKKLPGKGPPGGPLDREN
jgi:hypothetical protein